MTKADVDEKGKWSWIYLLPFQLTNHFGAFKIYIEGQKKTNEHSFGGNKK